MSKYKDCTSNELEYNFDMLKPGIYATRNVEIIDLAPPMSIEEACEHTRRFIKNLPDNLIDVDTGSGL